MALIIWCVARVKPPQPVNVSKTRSRRSEVTAAVGMVASSAVQLCGNPTIHSPNAGLTTLNFLGFRPKARKLPILGVEKRCIEVGHAHSALLMPVPGYVLLDYTVMYPNGG